ncbi:MAG: SUMF1/EgtB/PvdO family nonheme iron enzyme [Clostridia bacterium]|nr:SUMF1/EgtB/PvdO family nonheme iron enzyme [Clostridia bacterium]
MCKIIGVNIKSSDWGNYDDVSLTNLTGYYTNVTSSGANIGATDGFKSAKTLTTNSGTGSYVILTTGSTEQVKKMNLYDVAGNLWEWTTEASYSKDLNYAGNVNYNSYMVRGAGFQSAYVSRPSYFRGSESASNTKTYRGFRPALFLQ